MKKIIAVMIYLLTGLVALAAGPRTRAVVDTMPAHVELAFMNVVLNRMGAQSADVTLVSRHYATQGNRYDSTAGVCRFNGAQYSLQYDSVVQVQNNQYNMLIDHKIQVVMLHKRKPIRQCLWQLDLLDTAFVGGYVQRMYVVDSAGLKKVKAVFKPGSPYLDYELVYNPATYLPVSVKCVFYFNDGSATGGRDLHCWRFDTFSGAALPADAFATDPYFTRTNRAYQLTAPYTHYQFADYSALY